jgi:hypothetical protein
MKRLILLFFIILGLFFSTTKVHAQDNVPFSIKPQDPNYSFFSLEMKPGDTYTETLIAINHTLKPMKLKIIPVDGITALSGGVTFSYEKTGGTSSWISMPDSGIIEISSGNLVRLPFTITVPANTKPGDYIAGFLASQIKDEPQTTNTPGPGTTINMRTNSQIGITVAIHVPGYAQCELKINDLSNRLEYSKWRIGIEMSNLGQRRFEGNGFFKLFSQDGKEVVSQDIRIRYFIPGDSISYPLTIPIPEIGIYQVLIKLDSSTEDKCSASFEKSIEINENLVSEYNKQATEIAASIKTDAPITKTNDNATPIATPQIDVGRKSDNWIVYIGIGTLLLSIVFFVFSLKISRNVKKM